MNFKLTLCTLIVASLIVAAPNPASAGGGPVIIPDGLALVVLGAMLGGVVTGVGSVVSIPGNLFSSKRHWLTKGFVWGALAIVLGGATAALSAAYTDGLGGVLLRVGIPSAAVGAVAVTLAAVKYGLSSPSAELAFTPITDGTRVGPGLGLRIAW